jgi:hypothetical protein
MLSWLTPPTSKSARIFTWAVIWAALGLRLWHTAWGLPDFLEEAIPLHVALQMTDPTRGRTDWNPHFFNYPSLAIYIHFAVQQMLFSVGVLLGRYHNFADYLLGFNVDPTPMVIAARLTSTVFDACSVLGLIVLGNRLRPGTGWLAGLLVACASPMIIAGRSIFTDTVMVTFAIWSLERALSWLEHGGRWRLLSAAALCGLAASSKYPGALMLVPLALIVLRREPRRALWLAPLCGVMTLLAFLATSPYVLLDRVQFVHDFRFEGMHASTGHLGAIDHNSFGFFVKELFHALGPGAFLLFVASAAFAFLRTQRWPALLLWSVVLAFGIPISVAHISAERYVLPVLVTAALLAALVAVEIFQRLRSNRAIAVPALAALVFLPTLYSGFTAAGSGAQETQTLARRWCEAHVPDSALIVQEGYGIPLPSESQKQALLSSATFRQATPAGRARLTSVRTFNVVSLPLQVAGACTVSVLDRHGVAVSVQVFPHASDLNQLFYDPRLFLDCDLFVTSSAVRSRYEADPQRYAAQLRLYELLDRHATRLARFAPNWATTGPDLNVYGIGPECRTAIRALGSLSPTWWSVPIPQATRERILELRGTTSALAMSSAAMPESTWADVLSGIYALHVYPFAEEYAIALMRSHATTTAATLLDGSIRMLPSQEEPALMRSALYAAGGDWAGVRGVLESAIGSEQDPSSILQLQYGRALMHLGDAPRAAKFFSRVLAREPESSEVAAAARQAMAALPSRGAHIH